MSSSSSTSNNSKKNATKEKMKMSKAQLHEAIVKKKQREAKALVIVEQLLEKNINSQWLLDNLIHLNRSHMEDVIEERAIIKLCGYVQCDNCLSATMPKQRYRISMKSNKVYDISQRKNYCSSECYAASKYLLEQMLTSPLWLRDLEKSPEKFTLAPSNDDQVKRLHGDEIRVREENNLRQDDESKENHVETCVKQEDMPEYGLPSVREKKLGDTFDDDDEEDLVVEFETREDDVTLKNRHGKIDEFVDPVQATVKEKTVERIIDKGKREMKRKSDDRQPKDFASLVEHVEESFKEWITDDTVKFVRGEEVLSNVQVQERYAALCAKLNKLEVQEECENPSKMELQPLPHFSVLQEEAKEVEIKVCAFLKGSTIRVENKTTSGAPCDNANTDNVLPLLDMHAPKAVRRKIFLEKLNRTLPDLVFALAGNNRSKQYFAYNAEKAAMVKALVQTFNLSAKNILFKPAEWTLVGLIVIKMLSSVDEEMQNLLSSRQATMYSTMILMAYKLQHNYLDNLFHQHLTDSSTTTKDT